MGKTYNMTILLVGDDLFLRTSISEMLTYLECRIYLADDGEEALVLYQQHCAEIDLVLIERYLPGFDTEETLVAMHSINPGLRAFMLASDKYGMAGCEDLPGVCSELTRPFEVNEMARLLTLFLLEESNRMYRNQDLHCPYTDLRGLSENNNFFSN